MRYSKPLISPFIISSVVWCGMNFAFNAKGSEESPSQAALAALESEIIAPLHKNEWTVTVEKSEAIDIDKMQSVVWYSSSVNPGKSLRQLISVRRSFDKLVVDRWDFSSNRREHSVASVAWTKVKNDFAALMALEIGKKECKNNRMPGNTSEHTRPGKDWS